LTFISKEKLEEQIVSSNKRKMPGSNLKLTNKIVCSEALNPWAALRAAPPTRDLVQYSKDSPNAFFRKNPPAKIRKGGVAAPLTISSFSLAASSFKIYR